MRFIIAIPHNPFASFCNALLPIAVIKISWWRATGGRKGLLSLHVPSKVHHWEQSEKELKAGTCGTRSQEGILVTGLLLPSRPVCFLVPPRTICPGMIVVNHGQGLSTLLCDSISGEIWTNPREGADERPKDRHHQSPTWCPVGLLALFTGIWMRSYLQEHKWLKDSCITTAHPFGWQSTKARNLAHCTACWQLNKLSFPGPSRLVGWSLLLPRGWTCLSLL